jgi:hypothetical protein
MRKIGSYLAFFGLFAIVLNFMDRVLRLLMWIYNWGDTVGWAIKIGLVVIGVVLYFMGKTSGESEKSLKKLIQQNNNFKYPCFYKTGIHKSTINLFSGCSAALL